MSRYFYAENRQSQGPFNAQQLRDLAALGRIQPQTMVWKEGQPAWAPAGSYRGLFASPTPPDGFQTATPRPETTPLLPRDFLEMAVPSGRGFRLCLVVGSFLTLIALLGVGLVLLFKHLGSESKAQPPQRVSQESGELAEEDAPLPDPPAPRKVNQPEKKPGPVAEFTKDELLARYTADPEKALRELQGKRVLLKLDVVWDVADLVKLIGPDNTLRLVVYPLPRTIPWTPANTIFLTFPNVNPKSKIGFFARIREYGEKWKHNERVVCQVVGTLVVVERGGQKFLGLKDAELK